MSRGKILIVVPDEGFDVGEVALTWRVLRDQGHALSFAAQTAGRAPRADPRLLEGVLTRGHSGLFGKLNPSEEALQAYAAMMGSPEFCAPLSWDQISPADYDGIFLPGGHAPPMRAYLGSEWVQAKVSEFWKLERPVAAICHGVLVLARARDHDGRSLLVDRRVTCLPKYRDVTALWLTFWKLGRYYRTYPQTTEDEVRASLRDAKAQFVRGPLDLFSGAADDRRPLVVEDGKLVTGRLPGDAKALAARFSEKVSEDVRARSAISASR